jgi:hypothetical protein
VRPIRVLFFGVPPLARGLLGDAFAKHADMEIVEPSAPAEPGPLAGGSRADVVITQLSRDASGVSWPRMLFDSPPRNRLAITIEGEHVLLFEILPHQALDDPRSDALIDAIRATVGAWRTAE